MLSAKFQPNWVANDYFLLKATFWARDFVRPCSSAVYFMKYFNNIHFRFTRIVENCWKNGFQRIPQNIAILLQTTLATEFLLMCCYLRTWLHTPLTGSTLPCNHTCGQGGGGRVYACTFLHVTIRVNNGLTKRFPGPPPLIWPGTQWVGYSMTTRTFSNNLLLKTCRAFSNIKCYPLTLTFIEIFRTCDIG